MNRLNLDFSLNTTDERAAFVNEYTKQKQFQQKPLTPKELETIANYILWGKDPQTGKNVKQEKYIELESRAKTWDSNDIESLDALVESPTFRESQIQSLDGPKYRTPKEIFSREKARQTAPPHVLKAFESIWQQIDTLDLITNYYDLNHNKRKNPPRDELLKKFTPEEQEKLKEKASKLNQFKYLKMRHLIVELRREQFTLRDSYSSQILPRSIEYYSEPATTFFDADIQVFPIGLKSDSSLLQKIFNPERYPNPSDFNEVELKQISNLIWNQPQPQSKFFDFREPEHLYNAFLLLDELEDFKEKASAESTLDFFLETLHFYEDRADLSPLQKDLLRLKEEKWKNQDIADYLNKTYSKSYNANYISTIFKQKILVQIAAAAKLHKEILDNIFFPENFKKCKDCGQTLLLTTDNFMRKAKSKDGFSIRCKKCDKALRIRRANK